MWQVKRLGDGWGKPEPLPAEVNASDATFAPSVAADGSLYFMHPEPATGKFRLFRSACRHGHYGQAVPLPFSDGGQRRGPCGVVGRIVHCVRFQPAAGT